MSGFSPEVEAAIDEAIEAANEWKHIGGKVLYEGQFNDSYRARDRLTAAIRNVAIVARRHEHCRWRYLDDDTVECRISSPAAPVAPTVDSPEEGWNAVVSPHSTTTRDVYSVAGGGEG